MCVCVCVFITQFWVIFFGPKASQFLMPVYLEFHMSVYFEQISMFSETKAREESVLHRGRSGEVRASLC